MMLSNLLQMGVNVGSNHGSRKSKLTPETEARILELKSAGLDKTQIADETGLSYYKVSKWYDA